MSWELKNPKGVPRAELAERIQQAADESYPHPTGDAAEQIAAATAAAESIVPVVQRDAAGSVAFYLDGATEQGKGRITVQVVEV